MNKSNCWTQLIIFGVLLVSILLGREYTSHLLMEKGVDAYVTHISVNIGANLILIFLSWIFIKRNNLFKIAGLKETKLEKWYLLLFPLIYLVLLNALLMDEVSDGLTFLNTTLLLIYTLSIGLAEELSIRGFIQSHLINHFGNTKSNIILCVLASALFFGVIHMINFDKGLYGELSQVGFATFIGAMFGVLLLITRRLYPLIIIHAIIDFVAKLDAVGLPIEAKVSGSMSAENAVLIVLLVLPCALYALFLMKKYDLSGSDVNVDKM